MGADLTRLIAEHRFIEHFAGDGYTSPREMWITCTGCPEVVAVWARQQFYEETPEEPEDAKAAHLAAVIEAAGWRRVEATGTVEVVARDHPLGVRAESFDRQPVDGDRA